MVMIWVITVVPSASVTIGSPVVRLITVTPDRSVVAVIYLNILAVIDVDINIALAVINV
jgi:hypothetical protein